jgi:hypothetical protein
VDATDVKEEEEENFEVYHEEKDEVEESNLAPLMKQREN